jgi:hypothetical protein
MPVGMVDFPFDLSAVKQQEFIFKEKQVPMNTQVLNPFNKAT